MSGGWLFPHWFGRRLSGKCSPATNRRQSTKRRMRRSQFFLEPLEDRRLLSGVTGTAAGSVPVSDLSASPSDYSATRILVQYRRKKAFSKHIAHGLIRVVRHQPVPVSLQSLPERRLLIRQLPQSRQTARQKNQRIVERVLGGDREFLARGK